MVISTNDKQWYIERNNEALWRAKRDEAWYSAPPNDRSKWYDGVKKLTSWRESVALLKWGEMMTWLWWETDINVWRETIWKQAAWNMAWRNFWYWHSPAKAEHDINVYSNPDSWYDQYGKYGCLGNRRENDDRPINSTENEKRENPDIVALEKYIITAICNVANGGTVCAMK